MSASAVLEHVVILCIRGGFFLGCRRYLIHSLYADLQDLSLPETASIELETLPMPSGASAQPTRSTLHSTISRVVFASCFTETCMMFFLLLSQGLSIFQPSVRLVQWKISLALLLVNIILTIPSSISLVLSVGASARDASPSRVCSPRLLLNLIPVVLYLFALSYIPLPGALAPTGFVAGVLARLVVLGTTILGLLSGFGAISSAWPYLPFVNRAKSLPTEQDLRAAEHSLDRIRADLATLNGELTRTSASSTDGSWISRVATSFRGGDSRAQEMKGLRALEAEMSRNFDDLTRRYQEHTYRRTFRGRVVAVVGRLFAVYCVVRIVSSALHLLFPSNAGYNTTTSDLLTDLLAYSLSIVSREEVVGRDDVALISRQISLGLVGVIILMSLRLVLRGVTRALQVTSRNLGASLMLLVLAELIGIYLLSTIVQLRTSFPPENTGSTDADGNTKDTNLFSTIPAYEVFGPLFDCAFLATTAVSVFVRWTADRVDGMGR
ncbi:Abscisic acid G-protein coupled receptor-domain-containing protein [Schizophyllum amplum]|uniref:Abscisic acid G-protein coupled receptor-domain-containing protein n=1 Tax=Schizophyllum amplum TaxID=97359 RepID=A0A550BRJ7_9AGAR|nr:Abscisic acid G-protein coupled receptor-domain-containing protein [Auriculariopsis ampla]